MTLIEAIVLMVWLACGAASALYFGGRHGWSAGVAGAVGGMIAPYALVKGLMWIESKWLPAHPPCRSGRCSSGDYLIKVDPREPGAFIHVCKCGDTYKRVRTQPRGSERFVQLGEDGRIIPYLFHRPWRSWEPEPPGPPSGKM